MSTVNSETVKHWFTSILLLISIIWLGLLLQGNIEQLKMATMSFPYIKFFGALIFSSLALFMASVTYCFILMELANSDIRLNDCIPSYLSSQIVRYIPGKIWGIIYQANRMNSLIDTHLIWEANLIQFFIGSLASGIAISWVFLGILIGNSAANTVTISLVLMLFIALRKQWIQKSILLVTKHFSKRKLGKNNIFLTDKSKETFFCITIEWSLYLLTWIVLLHSIHPMNTIVIISILYVASWMVGFAVAILPGGIIVRESTFISLGALFNLDPGIMAFYAILGRLLFSLSDILNYLIAYAISKQDSAYT